MSTPSNPPTPEELREWQGWAITESNFAVLVNEVVRLRALCKFAAEEAWFNLEIEERARKMLLDAAEGK